MDIISVDIILTVFSLIWLAFVVIVAVYTIIDFIKEMRDE